MPTKWLQERHNGSKNDTGIGFEGPGVVTFARRSVMESTHGGTTYFGEKRYRGTSLTRNSPHPLEPPYDPKYVLLQVPVGALFLVSEVPL